MGSQEGFALEQFPPASGRRGPHGKARLLALAALVAAVNLGACANGRDDEPEPAAATEPAEAAGQEGVLARTGRNAREGVSAARSTTREGIGDAATAPLDDLNITRNEIPISLAAIDYVYTAYPPPDCVDIAIEIARLDTDLGRDYDAEAEEGESIGERGGEAVGDLVVDTIRGVTTDVIPFRSAVREVSGAAAFERRRSRAYAAGYARRAYLKGLALGQGCEPPSAPRVITAPVPEGETATTTEVDMRTPSDRPVNREWGPVTPEP